MTLFDYIAGGLLLISALVGFARGATREITTVAAFVLAAVGAVFGLRITGPIVQHSIHTAWLANALAALLTFVALYVVLRLIGGMLTKGVRRTAALSTLDRGLGGAIGVVRGLVVLGGLMLLITAAAPDHLPDWIERAKLYPLARAASDGLKAFAPKSLRAAHTIGPAVANVISNSALSGDDNDTPSNASDDMETSR